jgi:DUF2934 family protein
MKIESYEELRARLMRDPEVRGMIQKRAYEIYLHRGNQPGGEAHDWLQAESEILGQLLEQGSIAGVGSASRAWDPNEQTAAKKPGRQRVSKSSDARGNSSGKKVKEAASRREAKKKTDDSKKSDKTRTKKKKKADED